MVVKSLLACVFLVESVGTTAVVLCAQGVGRDFVVSVQVVTFRVSASAREDRHAILGGFAVEMVSLATSSSRESRFTSVVRQTISIDYVSNVLFSNTFGILANRRQNSGAMSKSDIEVLVGISTFAGGKEPALAPVVIVAEIIPVIPSILLVA